MGLFGSFMSWFGVGLSPEQTEKAVSQTAKELTKNPDRAYVVNRYMVDTTETIDEGIYGYPTRSQKWQLDGGAMMEEALQQTPKIRSTYNRLMTRVFSVPLSIQAADESEESQELKRYNDQILAEVKGSMTDCLSELTKTSMFWGYSLAEIVPMMSQYKEFEGKRVINQMLTKRPGLFQFITNDYDQVLAIQSLVSNTYYPLSRFITMTYDSMFSNPYGNAQWNSLSSLIKLRGALMRNMGAYSNWYTMPIPVVSYPSQDSDLQSFAEDLVDNMIAGSRIAMPDQIKAELKTVGLKGDNPFLAILNWIDDQISESIAGYDLSQEVGSRAADEVKSNELQAFVESIRRYVEEVYNEQIIRRFTEHNFDRAKYPLSKYPKAKFMVRESIDRLQEIQILEKAMLNGILDYDNPSDRIYIRERLEFPRISEEERQKLVDEDEAEKFQFESEIDDRLNALYDSIPNEIEAFEFETNFPENGDDKVISLKNSNFKVPDYNYVKDLKDNWPQIWQAGGNDGPDVENSGDDAFRKWGLAREGSDSEVITDWINLREAWAARHFKDFRLAGVVSQLKWGVIGSRGFDHQKAVIEAEKDRLKSKS